MKIFIDRADLDEIQQGMSKDSLSRQAAESHMVFQEGANGWNTRNLLNYRWEEASENLFDPFY